MPTILIQFTFLETIFHYTSRFIGTQYALLVFLSFFQRKWQIKKTNDTIFTKTLIYYETELSSCKITESHVFCTETLLRSWICHLHVFKFSIFKQKRFFSMSVFIISLNRRSLVMVTSREITSNNNHSQNKLLSTFINKSLFTNLKNAKM